MNPDEDAQETTEQDADTTAEAGTGAETTQAAAAAEGTTEAGTEVAADAGETSDWRAPIEDAKTREYAGKFTSVSDLADSALKSRQQLSKAIVPPGKNASDEDIAAFREKIGVPKEAAGYKITYPENIPEALDPAKNEGMKAQVDEFLAEVHAKGGNNDVAQAVIGKYFKMAVESKVAHDKTLAENAENAHAGLMKEWGGDMNGNINAAKRAATEFGGDEFAEFVENTEVDGRKLGDHPGFLKAFAKIGRRMSESGDVEIIDDAGRQSAQDRIDQINEENPPGTAGYAKPAVQKELQALFSKISGDGAIVGSQGRTA